MAEYVAFLRAVNVGGRIIKMADLKTCFEKAGFKDVRTVIASGNVIFASQSTNQTLITQKVEKAIEKSFGIEVRVQVFDQNRLAQLVNAIPSGWINDKEVKCDVMLLWPEIDKKSTLDLLPLTPGLEDVKYLPGAIIWRIDRDKAPKSRMFKIAGTKLSKQMTVRNPNTMRKIHQLVAD